jgi:arabinofuranan 3-O-arabinosyltransferase
MAGGLLLAYVGISAVCAARGWWFVGADGRPVDSDFVNVWAAGRMAVEGSAAAIYDWGLHKEMEVRALGHAFAGYYGWHYPPMLLFAAVPLALLPYLTALFAWEAVTAVGLAAALRLITPSRPAILALMAAPATLWCLAVGQNGFLTASLLGAGLAFLERRPLAAGVCFGLLTYKPHFGLLIPVALLAGRRWRAFAAATLTALLFAVGSGVVFGLDVWRAFLGSVSVTTNAVLRTGGSDWAKLQSVYAIVHQAIGDDGWAWGAQAAVSLTLAGLVAWVFRRPAPFSLQAALLATASLLATPYSYIYDTPVLAVPAAFLIREGLGRGFLRGETALLAVALAMPALFTLLGSATTLVSCAILFGLCLRRWPERRVQYSTAVP